MKSLGVYMYFIIQRS